MQSQDHSFARQLCRWQRTSGRHGLPWQVRDPYRRWLSEVMLQQTQVSVVIGYFERFLKRFPTLQDLAHAPLEDVMPLWAGLGYYSRCRNLHACAQCIMQRHAGQFPRTVQELCALPGIGRSTAGAIASACWDVPAPILDGNAKRVIARHFGIEGHPADAAVLRALWAEAERQVPREEPGVYAQALMDLGSAVCTRHPHCGECPVAGTCWARIRGRQEGIPAPRARRPRPVRRTSVLLMAEPGGLWLVYRSKAGVWRGLWALPERPAGLGREAVLQEAADAGFKADDAVRLEDFVHDFSHYRLVMEPWLVRGCGPLAEGRLVPAAHLAQEAVPAPVARLAALAGLQ